MKKMLHILHGCFIENAPDTEVWSLQLLSKKESIVENKVRCLVCFS